uniref:Uncharacterized protein n=1 Tax=Medicago truncatula TaxID=3880 RepID=A2Q2F2_MEDTR|nr:hypothetical protein MtrDRAFT_AC150798g29v2 [Medicago truncatula]
MRRNGHDYVQGSTLHEKCRYEKAPAGGGRLGVRRIKEFNLSLL